MNVKPPMIGIDRYIDAEWMRLASAVVRGEVARDVIQERLEIDVPSPTVRSKTNGILNRMWFPQDRDRFGVVDGCAAEAGKHSASEPAMFLAVGIMAYPYIRQVAEHLGRLIRIQGSCKPGEVHRRMFELHGKRTTIDQATSYAFKTLGSWGIITREEDRFRSLANPLGQASQFLLNRAANISRSSVTAMTDNDPLKVFFR
ncbi:hypothetical protein MTsPCn7_17950 [Altererythrobacter sp. MTPC7]